MIVLITGATSGFGMACAELFSKKGYKTILIGRRKVRLVKLAKKLGVKNNLPIQLDVRNKDDVFQTILSMCVWSLGLLPCCLWVRTRPRNLMRVVKLCMLCSVGTIALARLSGV